MNSSEWKAERRLSSNGYFYLLNLWDSGLLLWTVNLFSETAQFLKMKSAAIKSLLELSVKSRMIQ